MNDQSARQLAYDMTVCVGALLEGMGMMSENMQRQQLGQSMAFVEKDFTELIERTGMHHNSVCIRWEGI